MRCRFGHVYRNVDLGEFGQRLATHTARRCETVLLIGDHGYGEKLTVALADRVAYGVPFGAHRRSEGGVLYVATSNDALVGQPDGSTDGEITVRTVGIVADGNSRLDQLLHAGV